MTSATMDRPVLDDLDLPGDDGCQAERGMCGETPVAVAFFDPICRCHPNPQRVCAGHRDFLAREIEDPETCGYLRCQWCQKVIRVLRLEPLP